MQIHSPLFFQPQVGFAFPSLHLFITVLFCVFVFQVPPVDLAAPIRSPPGFHSPVMMSPSSLHPGVHPELTQVIAGEETYCLNTEGTILATFL